MHATSGLLTIARACMRLRELARGKLSTDNMPLIDPNRPNGGRHSRQCRRYRKDDLIAEAQPLCAASFTEPPVDPKTGQCVSPPTVSPPRRRSMHVSALAWLQEGLEHGVVVHGLGWAEGATAYGPGRARETTRRPLFALVRCRARRGDSVGHSAVPSASQGLEGKGLVERRNLDLTPAKKGPGWVHAGRAKARPSDRVRVVALCAVGFSLCNR